MVTCFIPPLAVLRIPITSGFSSEFEELHLSERSSRTFSYEVLRCCITLFNAENEF
jgi:hypothetical protein